MLFSFLSFYPFIKVSPNTIENIVYITCLIVSLSLYVYNNTSRSMVTFRDKRCVVITNDEIRNVSKLDIRIFCIPSIIHSVNYQLYNWLFTGYDNFVLIAHNVDWIENMRRQHANNFVKYVYENKLLHCQ